MCRAEGLFPLTCLNFRQFASGSCRSFSCSWCPGLRWW